MFKLSHVICVTGLCGMLTTAAMAGDGPFYAPPHAMLFVEIDENNKLFSNSGVNFDASKFTTNALGHTILKHDKGGVDINTTPFTVYPGGIAERDGDAPLTPATTASTKKLADDPGFNMAPNVLPGVGYIFAATYHNALRYFDGSEWSTPINGEQIRIFDLDPDDSSGDVVPHADLELFLTQDTSGPIGTINITQSKEGGQPGSVTGVHGHVGYELSQPDGQIPAFGAYMIELTVSATQTPAAGGPIVEDSNPIFVIFDNQSDEINGDFYDNAVTAAEQLPEPSSAILLAATGVGLLGMRRRRATQK